MVASDPFGLVGQVLDGQFRVDRHVGEGGFSIVYRGTHIGLSEPIAIKCLKLPTALGSALVESFVRRFRDESRIHYKLSQGNLHIVRSMASGTTIAPATSALVPYTVLEWLEGQSLAQDFSDRRDAGLHGRPLREVLSLLDSAIEALAFAHAQGVIHRDLNPGNFFLAMTPSGVKVKILDFGVAKVMADSAIAMGPTAQTVGNMRMFAPAYGAPEQFDDRLGPIGPWTDVYTIALVVLEALTDRTVMDGEHLGEFAARALDEDARPSPRALGVAVGDATQRVFVEALALDPNRRPRDAGEFWGRLKNATQVDARSGRFPHADMTVGDEPPTTLRVNPSMMAGTVRMDRAAPRSASEVLAATPPPARNSPYPPAPQRTSAPPGVLTTTLHMDTAPRLTPLPPAATRSSSPPAAGQGSSSPPGAGPPAPAVSTLSSAQPAAARSMPPPQTPRMATPMPPRGSSPVPPARVVTPPPPPPVAVTPLPPPSVITPPPPSSANDSSLVGPPRSSTMTLVLFVVSILVVAVGVGLFWRAWTSSREAVPAAHP